MKKLMNVSQIVHETLISPFFRVDPGKKRKMGSPENYAETTLYSVIKAKHFLFFLNKLGGWSQAGPLPNPTLIYSFPDPISHYKAGNL